MSREGENWKGGANIRRAGSGGKRGGGGKEGIECYWSVIGVLHEPQRTRVRTGRAK